VAVRVGVFVAVFVGVLVLVLVGVFVGVLVRVLVGVFVRVLVGVNVRVFVGVRVGVLVGVGVMVGVMLGFPKFPVTSNEYGPLAAAGFSSVSQLESTPKKYVPGVRLLTVSVSACPSKGVSAPSTHELNWVQVLMT